VGGALMGVSAVVFQLAVDGGLEGCGGLPPGASWGALSRQLPRLLVQALNGSGDRGIRFFPFIGVQDQRRGFLHVTEVFPVATLDGLHQQPGVGLLVDGALGADTWRLRITDAASGRPCFDQELPFCPTELRPTLERCLFEITGALQWEGAPGALPAPSGEALRWFLAGRDEVLALEANMLRGDPTAMVTATAEGMRLAAADAHMRDHCLELAAMLVRQPGAEAAVSQLLLSACAHIDDSDRAFLYSAAAVFEVCREPGHALEAYGRAATAGHPGAAKRAGALAFGLGDLVGARRWCELALETRGAAGDERDLEVVGQLAAIAERQGDRALWTRLCEELASAELLPPTVARLIVPQLVQEGRAADAVRIGTRSLEAFADERHGPSRASLFVELARAHLVLGDVDRAREHLDHCLAHDADREVESDARRLLRFARAPDLVAEMLAVEDHLQAKDWRQARIRARGLVRKYRAQGEAWLVLGMVEQRRGKLRRAERAYRKALARDGQLADAHNRIGILLVARGRAEDGYGHLKEAVQSMPRDSASRLHMAQACRLTGRIAEGREHLAEAERLGARPESVLEVREQFFSDAG